MSLFSFISKQFIDVVEWANQPDGVLMWRFPFADHEIQYGAMLTVREGQVAVFVDEGQIADVFPPGVYKLTTRNLPLLTNLRHWDKGFESPFKSDVCFVSTRLQLGRKWGTPQPVTLRDQDFGMVRLRAFGMYSYTVSDARQLCSAITGANDQYLAEQLEPQLRNLIVSGLSSAVGGANVPFLDLAANQTLLADSLKTTLAPQFERYGLTLEHMAVENISLPEELQRALDNRIARGMAGDLQQHAQFQAANALQAAATNNSGLAGAGVALAAGASMAQTLSGVLQGSATPPPVAPAPAASDHTQKLTQLKALLDQGLISPADYDSAKAEVLKKLLG